MWRQEGRRVRNHQFSDVLGLLPAEEAAIRKALRESLKTAATEKCQDELSSSSDSSPSPSPKKHTGSKRRGKGSQSKQSAKRMKLKEQKDSNSTLTTFNGGTSTKSPSEHVTCKSPARLSMPPTCISDSSPVISDSASLKLMLSSSSDSSSSSSPFSSHQDSSTTSKKKLPKKTAKKSPKPKKVLLAEFSTPVKQKAKPLKGSGGRGTGSKSLKRKKNEDECIGEGASEPKIGKTKQHVVHGGVLSKGKAVKGKRTTPGKKNQKKMSKILADSIHVGSGLSSTLTSVNCPDIQDYATTESGIGDFGSPTRATCIADDSMEDYVEKQEQQKTTTFTCTYPAQRKFASNHTPPARFPDPELFESQVNLKEVPKTEDFITFLCLRGSSSVPEPLKKFSQPWTPTLFKRSKTVRVRSDNGKISKSHQYGSAVKKLMYPNSFAVSGSKTISQVLQV